MLAKLKPASGYSHIFHIGLNVFLPFIIFVLVRIDFASVGAALVIISKWRMFSVRPRHWLASIQANAVDIIAGLSFVVYMSLSAPNASHQFIWALLYVLWLVVVKPGTTIAKTSLQALVAQSLGINAVLLAWPQSPLIFLMLGVWVICFSAARHFFTSFEEQYTSLYAHTWGYFGAALMWLLGHWLLFYGVVAQAAFLLSVLGFGIGAVYYLEHNDRLSRLLRYEFIGIMILIVTIVLVFSDWGDKAI